MRPCREFETLIAERASGALEGAADARRLAAHLASCEPCLDELALYEAALGMARLPAPSKEERLVLRSLPASALDELREEPLATAGMRPLAMGMIAIAVIGPSLFSLWFFTRAEQGAAAAAAAALVSAPSVEPVVGWREPDPEALLQKVEQEHAELAIASDEELAGAELIADAAYARAVGAE
jgi:hypothetical protein